MRASALSLVALLWLLSACAGGGEAEGGRVDELTVGDTLPADDVELRPGAPVEVPLPTGVLSLAVDHDPGAGEDEGAEVQVRARDGVALLGLTWELEVEAAGSELEELLTGTDDPPDPVVTMATGGRTYSLPALGADGLRSGAVVVGVPEQEPMWLQVEYDGYAQVVDFGQGSVEGEHARVLAERADLEHGRVACRQVRRGRSVGPTSDGRARGPRECAVERWFSVPYTDALGWVEEGRHWVVVDLRVHGQPEVRLGSRSADELWTPAADVERLVLVGEEDAQRHELRLTFPNDAVWQVDLERGRGAR